MKKLVLIISSLLFFAFPVDIVAQQEDKSTVDQVKKSIKKGAKGVKKGVTKGANEVAEQTSELKSEVTDKGVENKKGPKGEDIFLSDDGRYYYKDGKGRRVYVRKADLKDKMPEDDDD